MKKVKRWRYYCDFCKKSGGSKYHMEKHEKGCTNNPDRECGMCRVAGLIQEPIRSLIAALGAGDKAGVDNLRKVAEGCPACMLTAVRKSGLDDFGSFLEKGGDAINFKGVDFSFKEEKKSFWEELNDESPGSYDFY